MNSAWNVCLFTLSGLRCQLLSDRASQNTMQTQFRNILQLLKKICCTLNFFCTDHSSPRWVVVYNAEKGWNHLFFFRSIDLQSFLPVHCVCLFPLTLGKGKPNRLDKLSIISQNKVAYIDWLCMTSTYWSFFILANWSYHDHLTFSGDVSRSLLFGVRSVVSVELCRPLAWVMDMLNPHQWPPTSTPKVVYILHR